MPIIVLQTEEYEFNSLAGTIKFLEKVDLLKYELLENIVNSVDHITIYKSNDPGLLGEINGDTIKLNFDTSEMKNSDPLMIRVFEG